MNNKKRNRKGFTIVELSIVIAVIAILAVALIPAFGAIIDNSKKNALEKQLANAYAEYVLAAGGDVELFKTLAEQSVADTYCSETNDIAVTRGQTVAAFDEWSYDESRQEGDIDVIYAPQFGYFAVAYLGITEQDEQTLDNIVVQELTKEISEAIDSGTYQFGTTQEYLPAPTVPGSSGTALPTGTPGETTPGTDNGSNSNVATVLIIVFAVIGGVAVIAIIIILTAYIVKKINGKSSGDSDDYVPDDEPEDKLEDEEEETEEPEEDSGEDKKEE